MPQATEAEARAGPLPAALAVGRRRGAPLLVADSDLVYPSSAGLRLGPGWIAAEYAGLGGEVVEYGKPFAPIYDEALALAGGADPGEVLMIGDNLATDILGARRRGFDSLLVLDGGVHGALDAAALAAEVDRGGPTYLSRQLRW
jgi:ribonucleotide monophosphatase NagD (HAD superfamily)